MERSEFADAVSWATRTVGTRVTLPALSGILVAAEDGKLACRATDLEVSAQVSVPAHIEEPGRALLPGKLLAQLVGRLPDAPVHLAGDPDRTEIRCGAATFHVRGMPVEDFPTLPEPAADAPQGTVKADAFARLVGQVGRAASSDEARPVLTGVQLEAREGTLTAAATDSYRLAVRQLTWDEAVEADALVPARALQEAARASSEGSGAVTLVLEAGQVSFLLGDRRLTTRLVEGAFPNYRQLLPEGYDTEAIVERVALVEALQRVAVVALGQANTPVRLTFAEDTVDLQAGSQEIGDAAEALPADIRGEGLTIAFNPSFLLAGLEATGTERIRIEMRDALRPAVLRPQVEGDDPVDTFTYLLMPMRTS